MLISASDLNTLMYQGILDEISRNDDTIITRAISAAENEARSYLSKYDLPALFGDGEDAPTVDSKYLEHLKMLVKLLTRWWLIQLSNPNIDFDIAEAGYKQATEQLKMIQAGKMTPEGWPYKAAAEDGTQTGITVRAHSAPQRSTR